MIWKVLALRGSPTARARTMERQMIGSRIESRNRWRNFLLYPHSISPKTLAIAQKRMACACQCDSLTRLYCCISAIVSNDFPEHPDQELVEL